MALNLVSPGVKVREVDLTVGRIDAANELVGAIAGPFERGPVNTPTLVETEQDLLKIFGRPLQADAQYEYWLSASSYLSYGGVLRVVRTSSPSLNNANVRSVGSGSTTLKINSYEDYQNNYSDGLGWTWAAKNPGSWANDLKVCVIDNHSDQIISGVSTQTTTLVETTFLFTKQVSTISPASTVIGINTSNISFGQFVSGTSIATETTVISIGDSEITISDATINQETSTDEILNFSDVTETVVGSNIQVGYAVTQVLNKSVVVGSSITTYTGHLRGVVTEIGANSISVKLTDRVDLNGNTFAIDYKNPGNGSNVFSFDDPSSTTPINVVTASGITTNVYTSGIRSDWYDNQTLGLTNATIFWKSIASKPGTSEYALERNSKNDEVHVVVVDDNGKISGVSGTILEKFTGLSKSIDGRISPSQNTYFKDFISDNSQYIFAGTLSGSVSGGIIVNRNNVNQFTLTNGLWGSPTQNIIFDSLGRKSYSLTGGLDYSGNGQSTTLSEIITSYEVFKNSSEYKINFLICGPSGGASIFESQAKANALIAIAEERKDCIACISPHKSGIINQLNPSQQTNNIIQFFEPLTSSSYAIFDSGYKYTFDRFNNKFVYIPCNADVAGLMARTSIDNYSWFSPAGVSRGSINNAIKLAYNPSQSQRDQIYIKRINPIISSSGSGFILFGDKTALGQPSAFDRINVRRLFLTLEETIEKAAREQLFEFNDIITRTNFINIVEPYLRDVRAKRGITEFVVICDESNNTPDIIDANQFKADIFVKPARSINFVGLTFVSTRTGVSFSEVVGTV